MSKKFTTDYQPQGRGRPKGLKNKKTIVKEQLQELYENDDITINPIAIKQELLQQLLSKKSNSLAEMELINKIVSDLLPYTLDNTTKKEVKIIKEDKKDYIMSTHELIAQFQPKTIEHTNINEVEDND